MLPLQVEEKLRMFRKEKYAVLREKEEKELEEKSGSGKVNQNGSLRWGFIMPVRLQHF